MVCDKPQPAHPYSCFPGRIGVDVEIEVSQEEKASRGIESLPADLHAAICELQKDAFIKEVLGEHISSKLIEAKEAEWMQYRTQVTGWEIEEYLYKI